MPSLPLPRLLFFAPSPTSPLSQPVQPEMAASFCPLSGALKPGCRLSPLLGHVSQFSDEYSCFISALGGGKGRRALPAWPHQVARLLFCCCCCGIGCAAGKHRQDGKRLKGGRHLHPGRKAELCKL